MRNRKPFIFLAVYFLMIFLWLWFCYRKVQKACIEAGHTAQSSILEVVPWQDSEERSGEKWWTSFLGDREEEVIEAEKVPESEIFPEAEKEQQSDGAVKSQEPSNEKREEEPEKIRVVLLGTGGVYHDSILLEAGDETLEITEKSPYFEKTGIIRIRITEEEEGKEVRVMSLDRSCGHPSYGGILEVRKEEAGLVLINEVDLEEYVMGVLPSEMPLSYPLEALKAQAVCARTYAKMKQENKAYPQYDAAVDDSTACQVYRNLETSQQGDQAVKETEGEVLQKKDGSYMECYYYSTSCGRGAEVSVWHGGETERPEPLKDQDMIDLMNQEFFDYISQKWEGHLEVNEAFYRWKYQCKEVDEQDILKKCQTRQGVNEKLVWAESKEKGEELEITEKKLGDIKEMSIVQRQEEGVADCLRISCQNGTVYVWGEYNIRFVLAQGGNVKLQDDTNFSAKELLPSAFISLQSICNEKGNMVGYIVVGGGFGHGVGLSQNGAKHMALAGNDYQEILETYYGE